MKKKTYSEIIDRLEKLIKTVKSLSKEKEKSKKQKVLV